MKAKGRRKSSRKRFLSSLVLLSSFAVFPAFWALAQTPDNAEQRLEELQKKLEEVEKNGQVPSPELMNELGKILQEMQEEQEEEEDEEEGSSCGKWSEVPFSGSIVIGRTLVGNARMPDESGSGGSSTWSGNSFGHLSAMITGSEEIKDDEGNVIGYQPVGHVSGTLSEREVLKWKDGSMVSRYSASNKEDHSFDSKNIDGWCKLTVNPSEGRYELSFPSIYLGGGQGETVIKTKEGTQREPWHGLGNLDWVALPPDRDKLRYRPESGFISGSHTYVMPPGGIDTALMRKGYEDFPSQFSGIKGEILRNFEEMEREFAAASGKTPQLYRGNWTITWSLNIGKVPVKVELEPVGDYENWMPEIIWGVGNFVRARVKIVEPAGFAGKIRFDLEDVSREPGVCMNYPFDKREEHPDLFISEMSGSGILVKGDGQSAVTADEVNEAEVVIQPRDFAASGKLSAVATVTTGGKEMEVRALLKRTGEHWLRLPLDENGNFIADSWEKARGIYPCAGDVDDDAEPDGKAPGDGISAFEEYRGFFVGGKHVRLDPAKKDLFIHDPDALAQNADFGGITRLEVHYATAEEARCTGTGDKARVVNFNSERYHIVDQHCLWIRKETLPSPDRFNWGVCEGGREIGPPRTADRYVLVFADQVREDVTRVFSANRPEITNALAQRALKPDAAWLESQIRGAIAMTTAHEACHGLGITHHYKSLRQTLPKTDDIEAAIMNMDISPSTGQMNCVMRYIWDGGKHPRLSFRGDNELLDILRGRPWPNTLCDTMDDCRGQMLVSDAEKGQLF